MANKIPLTQIRKKYVNFAPQFAGFDVEFCENLLFDGGHPIASAQQFPESAGSPIELVKAVCVQIQQDGSVIDALCEDIRIGHILLTGGILAHFRTGGTASNVWKAGRKYID
jgi:hypothetical protein